MASAEDVANVLNNSSTMNQIGQNNMAVNNAVANMYSQIDNILGISQANTASNLGEAALNRQWQEQQAAGVNAFNASEAAKNRAWQEYMSNTAHRRETYDLIAAGLNPVLSVSGGNGAAVTSGATASGVMGSGSQGQADTSGTSGVVNVLGKAVDALSQTAASTNSALTNLTVADKYNMFNEYIAGLDRQNQQEIAHIHGKYGLAQTGLAGEYGLRQTDLAGRYNVQSAGIHAAATRYAADQSAAASMYGSDRALEASKYSSDNSLRSSVYASDVSKYNAELNTANSQLLKNKDIALDYFNHQYYPNTLYGMTAAGSKLLDPGNVGSLLNSMFNMNYGAPSSPSLGDHKQDSSTQYKSGYYSRLHSSIQDRPKKKKK